MPQCEQLCRDGPRLPVVASHVSSVQRKETSPISCRNTIVEAVAAAPCVPNVLIRLILACMEGGV